MNSNFFQNKRGGILGATIMMFLATIVIVLILTVFVFGAGFIKKLDRVSADVAIYNEDKVEIGNIFTYMDGYNNLLSAEFSIEKGSTVEESIMGANYEK